MIDHIQNTQDQFQAIIIADSISSETSERVTTFQLRYCRVTHAELMTHRVFCIGGDARLDFELPGALAKGARRVYSMSIREFADKWFNGAQAGASPRFNGQKLDHLEDSRLYSVSEIAIDLGFASRMNLNTACRNGVVAACKKIDGEWVASGQAWRIWRNTMGTRRFSLRSRLRAMRIRQLNERTNGVATSRVVACVSSGVKPVLRIEAGDFSTTATVDHLFLTEMGWKRLGELIAGQDRLCAYRYGTGVAEDPFKKIDGRWVSRWSLSVRDQVAQRQGGLCAASGKALEPSFHIHHVKPRHERPDLAFDIDNVVAVNADDHRALHGTQGWQNGVPLGSHWIDIDMITPEGDSDTYDLSIAGEFANFFADGLVVHNSRNASSSRAIPIKTLMAQVHDTPFIPLSLGKNGKGMQAKEDLDPTTADMVRSIIYNGRQQALDLVQRLSDLGVHKQVANRYTEPWQWISVLVTSTDYENWFALREHPDAEPHIQHLAGLMLQAYNASTPVVKYPGAWHLPYVDDTVPTDLVDLCVTGRTHEAELNGQWFSEAFSQYAMEQFLDSQSGDEPMQVSDLLRAAISAGRSARTSYKTFQGTSDIAEDLRLFQTLAAGVPMHASPLEHQVMFREPKPMPARMGGNLSDSGAIVQFRKLFKCERSKDERVIRYRVGHMDGKPVLHQLPIQP